MIPYGLKKTMSVRVHSHNRCDLCCSYVGKREGRSKARQEAKKEIRKQLNEILF